MKTWVVTLAGLALLWSPSWARAGTDAMASASGDDSLSLHKVYVGADYAWMKLSVSDIGGVGGIPEGHYSGRLYDLRVGYRLFKFVSVEAHAGIDGGNGDEPGDFSFNHYYGVFAVPTATVFDTVELSLPIGYAWAGVKQHLPGQPKHSASLDSAAFGANIELPLRQFFGAIPDLRLTAGGIVFIQRSDARIYGYHVGLRYDF